MTRSAPKAGFCAGATAPPGYLPCAAWPSCSPALRAEVHQEGPERSSAAIDTAHGYRWHRAMLVRWSAGKPEPCDQCQRPVYQRDKWVMRRTWSQPYGISFECEDCFERSRQREEYARQVNMREREARNGGTPHP